MFSQINNYYNTEILYFFIFYEQNGVILKTVLCHMKCDSFFIFIKEPEDERQREMERIYSPELASVYSVMLHVK